LDPCHGHVGWTHFYGIDIRKMIDDEDEDLDSIALQTFTCLVPLEFDERHVTKFALAQHGVRLDWFCCVPACGVVV
jgi:hypothetical protein